MRLFEQSERRDYHLLIVEDNPTDALLLQALLEETGLRGGVPHICSSLSEASLILKDVHFDLALVDLGLPDSQGVETVQSILAIAPALAVIVMTGHDDRETALHSIQAGAQDFLVKGQYEPITLEMAIRYAIERNEIKKELTWLSTAVAMADSAIMISDVHGVIQWINPAFTTLTGYSQQEAVGRPSSLLNSGREEHSFYENIWTTILRGDSWHGEIVNRRKDGSLYHEEMTITPIRGEKNSISHFIAIKQDISARKAAEAVQIRQQKLIKRRLELETVLARISSRFVGRQDLTEALLESLRDLTLLLQSDAACMYLFENQNFSSMRKLSAWPPEDADISKIASVIVRSLTTFTELNELTAKGVITYYGDISIGENPGPGLAFVQETGIRSLLIFPMIRDGTTTGVLTLIAMQPTLNWHDGDEEIFQVLVNLVFRALEFRESNNMLSDGFHFRDQIINSTSSAVLVTDRAGMINFASKPVAALTGFQPEEIRGRRLLDLGPGEMRERCAEAIEQALATRQRQVLEGEILHSDDTTIRVRMTLTPLRDAAPHRALVAVIDDLTETHSMELQIQQAGKMATLGEMATGMAHELNQPLSVILMGAQLLQLSVKQDDYSKEFLLEQADRLRENVARATAIINHLRVFGRKSDGNLTLLDVNEPLRQSMNLLTANLRQSSTELRLTISPEPLIVLANAINLEQVFINLVRNAIDALNEQPDRSGPKFILITSCQGDSSDLVVLRFKNNGPPIPHDKIDKIFDPFFTTKEAGKGTGLGLSICYSIIKRHRGTIQVRNLSDGVEFEIVLPHAIQTSRNADPEDLSA